MKLSAKQEKFVNGLISGLSQRQAYINAGYSTQGHSELTIDSNASRLFKNNKVLARYNELMEEHKNEALWTRKDAVNTLKWLLQKSMKSITDYDDGYVKKGTADAILGTVKELNQLELLYPLDVKKAQKYDSELGSDEELQDSKIIKMINKLDEVYGNE